MFRHGASPIVENGVGTGDEDSVGGTFCRARFFFPEFAVESFGRLIRGRPGRRSGL